MYILGIETSCDETAVSIVRAKGGADTPSFDVLGSAVQSQIKIHAEYGGVFPALAKREHSKNIIPVLEEALSKSKACGLEFDEAPKLSEEQKSKIQETLSREPELAEKLISFVETNEKPVLDMIAVTVGPGLEPALWVGIKFAEALGIAWTVPVHGTNHMEGHVASVLFKDSKFKIENRNSDNLGSSILNSKPICFPAIALLVSGGHTELVLMNSWSDKRKLGETLDDAVGEAFDKVARTLGLPYPGGPQISKLAAEARASNIQSEKKFPRPMIASGDYNFSFSGLKTAVLYYVRNLISVEADSREQLSDVLKLQIAREFEDAVVETIISKTRKAIDEFTPQSLIVGGGVVANAYLRESLSALAQKYPTLALFIPEHELSTDNATMIAGAAYIDAKSGTPDGAPLWADGNLDI
jgi:N6-L-threonylcarbamoyladenine synthase